LSYIMVDFHDATKLNGARKSDTHLKSSTSIFLSFVLFDWLGRSSAVVRHHIPERTKAFSCVFGRVRFELYLSLVGVVMPEHNLTSIAKGMLESMIIQKQFVVLCSTWAFQFLLELVVF
jgi:hypothetical protein